MKKILLCLSLFLYCLLDVEAIEFLGTSYVIIDGHNGIVLQAKNMHKMQSVASISKVMTAIVAIENGNLNDEYVIGEEVNKAWGSGVYIHIGDKITLQDLLYGLMLRSGNDAALCIAVNIAGSIEEFVEMMNQKAKQLNLEHTVFSNPTGLDEEDNGNQSCAYDMALLMKYASENAIFNDIVSTKIYRRLDGGGTWKNKNRLLDEYEYCVGGKTGYTKKAKRTLMTRSIKDNMSLIIVTFNCGNDFEFHKEKYIECFKIYQNEYLLPKGIYQYNGHSFLIDKDIIGIKKKDKEVAFLENHNEIEVVYDNISINRYSSLSFFETVSRYWLILFGEMING